MKTPASSLIVILVLMAMSSLTCHRTDHLVDVDLDDPNRDTDGDGVLDTEDRCPTVANQSQDDLDGDGTPDACDTDVDGDGVENGIDLCPNVVDPNRADLDNDGTGDACDLDIDGDDVSNETDRCERVAGTLEGCPDTDNDGVADSEDRCPNAAGEFDGCPDTDGDGVHDGEDTCRTDSGEFDGCPDSDGDGIHDGIDRCREAAGSSNGCPDTDRDGVDDGSDRCPDERGTENEFMAGCPDSDRDGMPDVVDQCPNEAAPRGTNIRQTRGCPQMLPPPRRGRGSCPYVYLWDGSTWDYNTDLSGSVLGADVPFFRPAFYGTNIYWLEGFQAVEGTYRMRLREVIQESSFFDEAALLVVDVPEGYGVHTQWSFTSQLEQEPTLEFLSVRDPRPPLTARADDGSDVLAHVSIRDGRPLPVREDQLSRVVVDFGPTDRPEHARLVVTAWGYYDNFTQDQRPPYSAGTTIETLDENGEWQVRLVAGKAAGDSKTWIIDIGGLVTSADTRMRITMAHQPTAIDVLDAVAFDDSAPVEPRVTRVTPRQASLSHGGAARVDFSNLQHRIRADSSHMTINPGALLEGRYTRYGEVLPLLGEADDRFVVMAHGDQLELEFEAPPVSPGTSRYVFLEADVFYTLMYHPLRFLTTTIEPMPYHGMERYPYPPESWPYANDAGYREYLETWNTRLIQLPDEWSR